MVNLDKFMEVICQISYIGDIRFKIGGENPNKITNIVKG